MSENKKNGYLIGWPPFVKFKQEIKELLSETLKEHNRSIKKDITNLKDSLISHILKTDKSLKSLERDMSQINTNLTNHVTDTDKKIDRLEKENKKQFKSIIGKLDGLLEK